MPDAPSPDDLLDRLVAEFSDRLIQRGESDAADLLAQAPEPHRPALERCFRMIRAGATPVSAGALVPGRVIDDFRIGREIGRGGMAVVYEAVQLSLDRPVALKFLRPGLAAEPRNVDRFRREALAIARLEHPGIVRVFAVGEAGGQPYIAMQLVPGTHLRQVFDRLTAGGDWSAEDLARAAGAPALAQGHASFATAFAALMERVARAVCVAHEIGIVHRDLKPSNILIQPDGKPVVADFGLAKGSGDPGLSLTGEPLGTPFYMSPEQAALTSNPVDERSDVYSLGVTLYEGFTGRRPYEGETAFAVMEAIKSGLAPAPRSVRAGIDRNVDAVVRRAMAQEPGGRYPSALELAADLAALAQGQPSQALAREGSGVRWWWNRLRGLAYALFVLQHLDYTSPRTFLGLPLVQVKLGGPGPRRRLQRAKAWIALGEVAIGALALGPFAFGLVSAGGLAVGGMALGGFGLGLVSLAGMSAGGVAIGGMAGGLVAVGGMAWGLYATGGMAHGVHAHSERHPDPVALDFFQGWVPWL